MTESTVLLKRGVFPPSSHRAAQDGEAPIARVQILTPISVVVPTRCEAENIPALIERLAALREESAIELELLIMDDDSRDGSVEAVQSSGREWARIVVRTSNHGLGAAVVDGFRLARHPIVVCMDADLSHPPEKIPELLLALASGQDFAIGSRYVPGGSTHDDWGIFRWLNSRVATILARPLTDARDPMAGFFAMRKRDFERAAGLSPVGYKVALEFIVRCGLENIGEIPIQFARRASGQSKLSLGEQVKYLRHLHRLYLYKFGRAPDFIRFLAVGAAGTLVNLALLTVFLELDVPIRLSLAGGAIISGLANFWVNRRVVLGGVGEGAGRTLVAGVIVASTLALLVQYGVALLFLSSVLEPTRFTPQSAALFGIAAGTVFNLLGNRFLVFKRRYTGAPSDTIRGRSFSTTPEPSSISTASQSSPSAEDPASNTPRARRAD